MVVSRKLGFLIQKQLQRSPALALVGPRQAGKTTLSRALDGVYFDLEQESDRTRLDLQWDVLVKGNRLLILDEAQSWPQLFPRLRGAIDAARERKGRFLLLGSVSPFLMTQVSESLAGRLSLLELTPFVLPELPDVSLANAWLFGGYPDGGILDPSQFPKWQEDYLALAEQRDLPNWGLAATPQSTHRLFSMLAAVHGQLWNASQIGQSMGLSYMTVNRYLDYLEGAFLIRRLLPYQTNLKKRLVKSPKCYWRDSGLLHALLRVSDYNDLLAKPWVGASWEGFVIEQILGALSCQGNSAQPFFLRTSDQYEIDLVLDLGKQLWAVEIKLTSNPASAEFERLNKTADLIKADKRILISHTTNEVVQGNTMSCSLPFFLRSLQS